MKDFCCLGFFSVPEDQLLSYFLMLGLYYVSQFGAARVGKVALLGLIYLAF